VVVGNFLYTWITNRTKANGAAINRVETDLNEVVRRVDLLEQKVEAAPTHDDVDRIYRRIDDINGEMKQMHGEISGSTSTLNLIHDYLLNKGGR